MVLRNLYIIVVVKFIRSTSFRNSFQVCSRVTLKTESLCLHSIENTASLRAWVDDRSMHCTGIALAILTAYSSDSKGYLAHSIAS